VKEIPEHVLDNVTISSTRIRAALLHNDIATADSYLGYDYFFEGTVIKGNQLGRTIGYPTANLMIENEEKLVPGNGVYAVEVTLIPNEAAPVYRSGTIYQAMMNIGNRPTVDGKKRTIEVNIFDFDQDIYGQMLRVYVKKYLRGEVKFNGLDALKDQLAKDKIHALEELGGK
jgi:riboflavin kinase / FMN adenylyltransferase